MGGVQVTAWDNGTGDQQAFQAGRDLVVKRDGRGGATVRFYPAEFLSAIFQRTLVIDEWPSDDKGLGIQWIFTGPEGSFTVTLTETSVRLTQRYHNSYGLNEIVGNTVTPGHYPGRKWLDNSVEYRGQVHAVTIELDRLLDLVVRLNGAEVLRQECRFDVQQHQIAVFGGDRVRLLAPPPPRAVSVTIDPQKEDFALQRESG